MPEHQGNPAPCTNTIIWLDFDPSVGGGRGVDVVDLDTFQSQLIIQKGEDFAVNTIFWLGGSQALAWKKTDCKFTIRYYAEPMTGAGPNVQLGVVNLATSAFTGTANFPCPPDSPYLIYDPTVTQLKVSPNPLDLGAYRLTALASFSNSDCSCPLPYNAYVTGPVLEVASAVEH